MSTCTKDTEVGTHFSMFFPKTSSNEFLFFGKRHSFIEKKELQKSRICSIASIPLFRKQFRKFLTGSTYTGEWNYLGFSGDGNYKYAHGVIYKGNFNKDGMFHGVGTLIYPGGQQLQGIWKNGKLTEGASYIFSCGEALNENFKYCQMPDRRFYIEIEKYFGPATNEYLTNDPEPRKIPDGCYDVLEGFYNPKYNYIINPVPSKSIESSEEIKKRKRTNASNIIDSCRRKLSDECIIHGHCILEIPSLEKEEWIKSHCRRAWDEPTGYRPDLYETWSVGRKGETFPIEYIESIMNFKWYNSNAPAVKSKFYSFIKKPQEFEINFNWNVFPHDRDPQRLTSTTSKQRRR